MAAHTSAQSAGDHPSTPMGSQPDDLAYHRHNAWLIRMSGRRELPGNNHSALAAVAPSVWSAIDHHVAATLPPRERAFLVESLYPRVLELSAEEEAEFARYWGAGALQHQVREAGRVFHARSNQLSGPAERRLLVAALDRWTDQWRDASSDFFEPWVAADASFLTRPAAERLELLDRAHPDELPDNLSPDVVAFWGGETCVEGVLSYENSMCLKNRGFYERALERYSRLRYQTLRDIYTPIGPRTLNPDEAKQMVTFFHVGSEVFDGGNWNPVLGEALSFGDKLDADVWAIDIPAADMMQVMGGGAREKFEWEETAPPFNHNHIRLADDHSDAQTRMQRFNLRRVGSVYKGVLRVTGNTQVVGNLLPTMEGGFPDYEGIAAHAQSSSGNLPAHLFFNVTIPAGAVWDFRGLTSLEGMAYVDYHACLKWLTGF